MRQQVRYGLCLLFLIFCLAGGTFLQNTDLYAKTVDDSSDFPSDIIIQDKLEGQDYFFTASGSEDESDDFVEYVEAVAESDGNQPRIKKTAGNQLTGLDKKIYTKLMDYISQVAEGQRASTVFEISVEDMGFPKTEWTAEELGVDSLITDDGFSNEAVTIVQDKCKYNLRKIILALLADNPYGLYWYDKTAGVRAGGEDLSININPYVIGIAGSIPFSFSVSADYAPDKAAGGYTVDTGIGQSVEKIVSKARSIVSNYSSASDYEKLLGYRETICNLVTYNQQAVDEEHSYGNPWQLIWVFDEDPGTNVVCEGYSKAFQYLCNLTDFDGPVDCITVTGTITGSMSGGSVEGDHMWNVVTMEDGNNYIVDLTNCDKDVIRTGDPMFLAGAEKGNSDGEYIVTIRHSDSAETRFRYIYDEGTLNLYDYDDLAIHSGKYESTLSEPEESTAEQPTTGKPEGPTAEQPTTEKSEEPTAEQPTAEKPEEPTAEQPTMQKPEESTTEKSEEATTREPTTEKTEGSTAEKPTTEKTEEPKPNQPVQDTDYKAKVEQPKPVAPVDPRGDSNDPSSIAGMEKQILQMGENGDPKGSSFGMIQLKASKATKNSIKLNWAAVKGAAGYIVYGNQAGKNHKYVKLAELAGGSRKTWTHSKLKKGTYYKYMLVSYHVTGGIQKVTASSKTVHEATTGGKVGNVKAVKVNKISVVLKKGKSFKLTAKEVPASKKMKVKRYRKLCYESSDSRIAAVAGSGKIKAKKKGTCLIYVYSQNGIFKKIKVRVK